MKFSFSYLISNIPSYFDLMSGNILVNTTDLQALYLSGTFCHKTGTRPPSCTMPQERTIYVTSFSNISYCINRE